MKKMIMKLRSRKGSFTVFVTMAFAAVLIMTAAVIYAAGEQAISSTAQNFGRLWGRSILAEYDRTLKERYGLFGFYGNEVLVEEKLDFYADYTFDEKDYISCGKAECSLEGRSLAEPENFKKQIMEISASGIKPKPLTGQSSAISDQADEGRSINNQWIIKGLPSGGKTGGPGIMGLIELIKTGAPFSSLLSETAEDVYAMRFFRNCLSEGDFGDTYFRNEIEYIISGKLDDSKAESSVRSSLITLRNGLNLAYLYSCEEKRQAVLAAAEAITPGPGAVLTQALIMETWAYLEARNDVKILFDNKPVRLLKRDENWAISLDNVLSCLFDEEGGYEEETGYIRPDSMEGMGYESYLRILLGAVPENTRLLRMMDVIQINMKYLYCDWFLLRDFYTGLEFSLKINGRVHEFTEEY